VEFAVTYSAFRRTFVELLAPAGRRPPPTQLVLFDRVSKFHRFCPEGPDDSVTLMARTIEVDGKLVVALPLDGDREEALQAAFEFETIVDLRQIGFSLPLWAEQGTGEVLSTLRVKRNQCILGEGLEGFSHQLERDKWFSWEKFSAIHAGSPEYQGEKKEGLYHAQAWAVMHWVLSQNATAARERFAALAVLIHSGGDAGAVLASLTHKEGAQIEGEIIRHLRHDPRIDIPFDEANIRAGLKTGPADEVEVRVRFADLLAAAGKSEEASNELARAQALAPDAAVVKEALARAAAMRGDEDSVLRLYREAIAAGSRNPHPYLVSAEARLNQVGTGGFDVMGEGGVPADEALAEIRKAIELDKENGEAYRDLGRAFYAVARISPSAVAELSRGMEARKQGGWVQYYRALLLQRLGNKAEAAAELGNLADSSEAEAEVRRATKNQIESLRFEEVLSSAQGLVTEGNFRKAYELINESMKEGIDQHVCNRYKLLRTDIESKEMQEILTGLTRQVQALVDKQKFKEALQLVDERMGSNDGRPAFGPCRAIRTWVEEQEALFGLDCLRQAGRLVDFQKAADEFLQRFPKSQQVGKIRQQQEAMQHVIETISSAKSKTE